MIWSLAQQGKWFWGSQEEAAQFAPYWYGSEPYRIVQTQLPSSVVPSVVQAGVDNVGTAYFFTLKDLTGAPINTVK